VCKSGRESRRRFGDCGTVVQGWPRGGGEGYYYFWNSGRWEINKSRLASISERVRWMENRLEWPKCPGVTAFEKSRVNNARRAIWRGKAGRAIPGPINYLDDG